MLCSHYIFPFQSIIGFENGPTNALFLCYILFPTSYYLVTSFEFKFEPLLPSWLSSSLGHTMQILLTVQLPSYPAYLLSYCPVSIPFMQYSLVMQFVSIVAPAFSILIPSFC